MKPAKNPQGPEAERIVHQAKALRFGDLEVDRHSFVVRGPRGVIDLSFGEFRACAVLVEAAGATARRAELAAMCGVDVRNCRNSLQLTISRLRICLHRRGSTVTVAATRGVGWRLLAASGSHARSSESDGTPES